MINYNEIFQNQSINYLAYRNLVDKLLAEGKTTGEDHSEAMLHYTKMNVQRMNRVDKTTTLTDSLLNAVNNIRGTYHLLVITEGWCGDAAQIVPVINQVVNAVPNKLDLGFVLRDENLPLIDQHLTNGGRAIPVVLILDENFKLVLPKWGPRPSALKELFAQWKEEGLVMPELGERLHGWYAKDKTVSIQQELAHLFSQLL